MPKKTGASLIMSSVPDTSETTPNVTGVAPLGKQSSLKQWFHLPRNVYLLLFFTLGKGFQLTIATLNISYYAHSLGYRPDFIALLNPMSALGALIGPAPLAFLANRIGRRPILIAS